MASTGQADPNPPTPTIAPVSKTLHVLIVEDRPEDAELMLAELRRNGFAPVWARVETEEAFLAALSPNLDVILADYKLPQFSGKIALELVVAKGLDVPFIIVTGTVSEEAAIQCIRRGAFDYLLKDRMARLGPAVTAALAERALRAEKRRAEAALLQSEARFRAIVEHAFDVITVVDVEGTVLYESPAVERIIGFTPEELVGTKVFGLVHPDDLPLVTTAFAQVLTGGPPFAEVEFRCRRKDGSWCLLQAIGSEISDGSHITGVIISRDITERRRAEEKLKKVNRVLRTLSASNEVLFRADDEATLMTRMCRAIVEVGGYRTAWIGLAETGDNKSVTPAAVWGADSAAIQAASIRWDDSPEGQGPAATAIRLNTTQIRQTFESDTSRSGSSEIPLEPRLQSAAAFPLAGPDGVFGALSIYASEPNAFTPEEIDLLNDMASNLAYGTRAIRHRIAGLAAARRLRHSMESTVTALAATAELRDPYTAGHQRRVAELAVAIALELGFDEARARGVFLAAVVHDIGKIHVPAELLAKAGHLSSLEIQFIHTHVQAGYDILKGIDFPWPIAEFVFQHHERLNGQGYPQGLTGSDIHLEARIIAVADVVEAMTSHRPYRPARSEEAALAEIETAKGVLYDRQVVDACVRLFRQRKFTFASTGAVCLYP